MDNIGGFIMRKIHSKIKTEIKKNISFNFYQKTNTNSKFIQMCWFHWLTIDVIQRARKIK
jgi:hypothetical protein